MCEIRENVSTQNSNLKLQYSTAELNVCLRASWQEVILARLHSEGYGIRRVYLSVCLQQICLSIIIYHTLYHDNKVATTIARLVCDVTILFIKDSTRVVSKIVTQDLI